MLRTHCQKCGGDLEPVDWLPEEGLEAGLRKLNCTRCHWVEYQVLTEGEQRRFRMAILKKAGSK